MKTKIRRSKTIREFEVPFHELSLKHGIIYQTPHSPWSNDVVEHKNQIWKEMMNVILISFGLPYNLGGEAILLAYYICANDINAHGFLVYALNISF